MDQVIDYTNIRAIRNGIISGIVRGSMSYTIERHPYKRKRSNVYGDCCELIVLADFEEIYNSDVDEKSVFDIGISRGSFTIVLKDVFIWPRPRCVYVVDNIAVIQYFKFRSWS